jgi:aldehyde:ferredoxin oxidoreductase
MLGLIPPEDTLQARINLVSDIDERLIQPIEQMGLDVIDTGLALSALLEGVEHGIIPETDVPDFLKANSSDPTENQIQESATRLETAVKVVNLLSTSEAANYPGLRVIGDGPQVLAEMYPEMQDAVFTCGKNSFGNAGHCNALWTFLMPFSRFFSHYSGQIYKIEKELPPPQADKGIYRNFFKRIVERILQREFFWIICNAFSHCAFTFIIFSQDGKGEKLRNDDLLLRILNHYGISTTNEELQNFSEAFWAQSIDLKCRLGWKPPTSGDFPKRIYEALASTLNRSTDELQSLMSLLIEEWKQQAEAVLIRHNYQVSWKDGTG